MKKNQCQRFIEERRDKFIKLLQTFEELFDGTLGTWKTDPVDFELKENPKQICSRPYPEPKVHDEIF